jgi:hypothetical protein
LQKRVGDHERDTPRAEVVTLAEEARERGHTERTQKEWGQPYR